MEKDNRERGKVTLIIPSLLLQQIFMLGRPLSSLQTSHTISMPSSVESVLGSLNITKSKARTKVQLQLKFRLKARLREVYCVLGDT